VRGEEASGAATAARADQAGAAPEFCLALAVPWIQKREEGKKQTTTATNPHWGFAPSQSSTAEGEEEGGKVGEEVEERWGLVSRAAAAASPPRSDEYARSRARGGRRT
jgi:hypothetical protein